MATWYKSSYFHPKEQAPQKPLRGTRITITSSTGPLTQVVTTRANRPAPLGLLLAEHVRARLPVYCKEV